jgi:malto-oligosyltrehalose trehalohydrolase
MSRFGPRVEPGATRFRLWAPSASAVALVRPDREPVAMREAGDGFYEALVDGAGPGDRYRFRIGERDVPDPASRQQETDAEGWSVVRRALPPPRRDVVRPWHEAVIAEVHVGTVSAEGTFTGLGERLGHFAEAGYTALEIMPLNEFVGTRNWGYDGVLPFAPDRSYGTPEELRALVDAAHDHGLAVLIDVVYNHFGPAGNHLHHYAEAFFAADETTPWGPAIALDNPIVRAFFCDNVAMWLEEYDADGLRFDAVHAFRTDGAGTFMAELASTARRIKPNAHLVLENDSNEARWLVRDPEGRPRHFTAQWNDDFHHVFYVAAGCDRSGHYGDYGDDPVGRAGRVLAEGFAYQGEVSARRKAARGEPSRHLPPEAFVSFVQNHDQIGNRPVGDRLTELLEPDALACLRFATMMSPHTPLFFMGEEAGLTTRFPFFCDFSGELADAVRKGRREEFSDIFGLHEGPAEELPDPLEPSTFAAAKIPWAVMETEPFRSALAAFRELAAARRRIVWPLAASGFREAVVAREGTAQRVSWQFRAGTLVMAINLGAGDGAIPAPDAAPAASAGRLHRQGERVALGPWSAALWAVRP